MDPFFTEARQWPAGGPYPHFVIPLGGDPAFRAFARECRKYLAPCAGQLGVVPDEWLHATVQGVHHTAGDEQMGQLREAARRELRRIRSSGVRAGPVCAGVTAVTVHLRPKGWSGTSAPNR